MFKEFDVDFCFTCLEMKEQYYMSASDPEGLVNDVFDITKKHNVNFEGENAIECYHWDAYNQVLKWASKGLKEFTFVRMSEKVLNDKETWKDFVKFTKKIHNGSKSKKCEKLDEEKKAREEKEDKEYFYINCVYNF